MKKTILTIDRLARAVKENKKRFLKGNHPGTLTIYEENNDRQIMPIVRS
jgi:hypothetical protein